MPEDAVYIHCAAVGLARPPLRPIFEVGRLTVQPTMWGFACQQFAMLGVVEATIDNDEEKNKLCRPIRYWEQNADYLSSYMARMVGERARSGYPALAAWTCESRLNAMGRLGEYSNHPSVVATGGLMKTIATAAMENMARLLAERS